MGFAMRMNFVDVVVSDSLKHYYVDGKKTVSYTHLTLPTT